jgi:hypothetical protein
MKHGDFKIGQEFTMGNTVRWRVTDIGSRVIIAIKLSKGHDQSWYNGPPYAIAEHVIDEYSLPACEPAERIEQ